MTTKTKQPATQSNAAYNARIERAESEHSTLVKIAIVPAAGEKFGRDGMDHAAKLAAIAAFELAAAFLRAIPPGCSYCLPHVNSGDTWAECARASVAFEHDGVEVVIAAIQKVIAQAK